jgi:hypothetical protein
MLFAAEGCSLRGGRGGRLSSRVKGCAAAGIADVQVAMSLMS